LRIPVNFEIPSGYRETALSACDVEIETAQGIVGHGFTAITEEEVIGAIVNEVAGPSLLGGVRTRVPLYATFGFGFLDRVELAEVARRSALLNRCLPDPWLTPHCVRKIIELE
jgi:hypothetical protein